MIQIQSKIGGRSENQDFYGSAKTYTVNNLKIKNHDRQII